MGVSMNVYTAYGVKIEYDNELSDKYYDKWVDENYLPIDIIFDSMGGKYIIIGKILFDSGDERYGWEGGDDFKIINFEEFDKIKQNVLKEFEIAFPDFIHLLKDKKFELFTFKYYS